MPAGVSWAPPDPCPKLILFFRDSSHTSLHVVLCLSALTSQKGEKKAAPVQASLKCQAGC